MLFLLWVQTATVYGAALTLRLFLVIMDKTQRAPPGVTRDQQSAIVLMFVLSCSVGGAVLTLFGWHIYLVCTAQTTIEFYGNQTMRMRAKIRGQRYRNPYDLGLRRNFELVFGSGPPFVAIAVPSARAAPWPPWPVNKADEYVSMEGEHLV